MRRRIIERLITMALGMALTAAMAGPAWAQPVSAQSSRLSVISVEGENAWIAKSGRKEEKAAAGVPLRQGQSLRTGESTGMYLNADGDKIIRLDSTTRAAITQATTQKLKLTLEEGTLHFDIKNKVQEGMELSFDTAHVSMNITGTSGIIQTSQTVNDGVTVVQLLIGTAQYTADGQTGTLEAGKELWIIGPDRPGQETWLVAIYDSPESDWDIRAQKAVEESYQRAQSELELGSIDPSRKRDELLDKYKNDRWYQDIWTLFNERKLELETASTSIYGKPEVESSEKQGNFNVTPVVTPDGQGGPIPMD